MLIDRVVLYGPYGLMEETALQPVSADEFFDALKKYVTEQVLSACLGALEGDLPFFRFALERHGVTGDGGFRFDHFGCLTLGRLR